MNTALQTAAANPENQDRGEVITIGRHLVLVVADGAGGRSGGAEAAKMAVDMVCRDAGGLESPEACVHLLRQLDQTMASDRVAGESTCVVVVVGPEGIFGASVGDSGAWLLGDSHHVNLTSRQVRKPMLGSGGACPVSFRHEPTAGHRLLLATDGLLKYASQERIAETCRTGSPLHIARQLIGLVRYPSGALPDDVTVIVAAL